MSTWDALDVSLHDPDLGEEVNLTTRLIVAVNEAGRALSAQEIDELLGIPARREPAAPVVCQTNAGRPAPRLTGSGVPAVR